MEVTEGQMDLKDLVDRKDHMDLKDLKDRMDLKDHKGRMDLKDHKDRMDLKDQMDLAHLEPLVDLEHPADLGDQDSILLHQFLMFPRIKPVQFTQELGNQTDRMHQYQPLTFRLKGPMAITVETDSTAEIVINYQ